MTTARVLLILLLASFTAHAQEDLTPFSVEEVESYLNLFKTSYNKKKVPPDDAVATLDNLKKAYRYLDSKGEEATKEEESAKKKIVSFVSKGLSARNRPLVTMNCAMALGYMGNEAAAKPLIKWMESKEVLKAKSPNPQYIEHGFLSLAAVGANDNNAMDLLRSYATGKHQEASVASHALKAATEWKWMDGKDRRELFDKVLQYLGSLHSQATGSDLRLRGQAEQKYNTVKDNGFETLWQLSGEEQKFADLDAAREWWKDNKKRRKWEDYEGPKYRKKDEKKKEDA